MPEFLTTEELLALEDGHIFTFDAESYKNYFLVAFQCYNTGKIAYFEEIEGEAPICVDWLSWMFDRFCVVGFNSGDYDIPIVSMAMSQERGVNQFGPRDLQRVTHELIVLGTRLRDLKDEYNFELITPNHIDLIEVAPLSASLKTYAARLHCKHLQDLPFDPSKTLTREEIAVTRSYCFNDLDNTTLLAKELSPHLELRGKLSAEFKRDLRSLSDAQIAQEIINSEIKRVTGKYPKRPDYTKLVGTTFFYKPPEYIQFHSQHLRDLLSSVSAAEISIGPTGHVICPKSIEGRKVTIGANTYVIGMGGLHSMEKSQALQSDEYFTIRDRDVTGYYPNLILKNGFAPLHLGPSFLEAFQSIVTKRYNAKKSGDTTTADGLKIASNGTFGKTSDPFSTIYDPPMTVQTTLTGQFSLLLGIDWLELYGFTVVSANTDGVVCMCPNDRYEEFCQIWKAWEAQTKLETEETVYKALYSRDVNNYVAIKEDGKIKEKGVYSAVGSALNSPLSKNPAARICVEAAIAHITGKSDIFDIIHDCKDIRKFVSVQKVTGGAAKDGRYLGKTIRWYYANGITGTINRCTNGNTVPLTEGAKPCMVLPDRLPDDINYKWYMDTTIGILEDIGYQQRRNQQLKLL